MIHEFQNPVPCTTEHGDGYVWYVKPNGMLENDEFCVIMCEDGSIKYFNSNQIKIWFNATYGIKKKQ